MLKKAIVIITGMFFSIAILSSCGHNVDVVDSGTYQGKVIEVKPDEQEIYVKTDNDKTLELYFTDSTKLTKSGNPADFSALEKGSKVEVKLEKMGKKMNPLAVKIK